MVEQYCTCSWDIRGLDSLPAHTHVPSYVTVRKGESGGLTRFPASALGTLPPRWVEVGRDPATIRVLVNWKEAYRP